MITRPVNSSCPIVALAPCGGLGSATPLSRVPSLLRARPRTLRRTLWNTDQKPICTAASATELGYKPLTFGGPLSNTSEPLPSKVAVHAVGRGMRLRYRSTYRRKADPDVVAALIDEFGPCFAGP